MMNIKNKLIVSIIDEPFETVIELAKKYKQIELRLSQLVLANEEVINIINAADLVVITDIAELEDGNIFHKINLNSVIEKIIIDCPIDKIKSKKLLKYIDNHDIKKIFSYHNISYTSDIFLSILEKNSIKINKNDIIKIAVEMESIAMVYELFSIFDKYLDYNLILIPLGKKFQRWRVKSLELGSKYMFCYIHNPVTDCQLHYMEYFFIHNNLLFVF